LFDDITVAAVVLVYSNHGSKQGWVRAARHSLQTNS
jgi:hypothetical protein